jgi:hypothetical protein
MTAPTIDMSLSRLPTISYNTASIIKYRSLYKTGVGSIVLASEGVGTRNIITALYSAGKTVTIGFGTNGVIDETAFTYSGSAGPLDLSSFFASAPFCHHVPGKDTIIILDSGTHGVVAYVPFKN